MKKPGYIIPLTLVIISMSIGIITYLYVRSSTFVPFANTILKREQAKSLALGGVQIALSQVAKRKEDAKQQPLTASPEKKKEKSYEEQLITNILPHLNQWQTFQLTREVDGIDAEVQISIISENGKIPINAFWDFKEKKFKDLSTSKPTEQKQTKKDAKQVSQIDNSAKPLLQELFQRIEKRVPGANLFQAFENFLKKRQYKLNDVTELLTIKEFEIFKGLVWYEPPTRKKEGSSQREVRPIYLTDLFSVYADSIDPWYLSNSMMHILDIQSQDASKEKVQQWVKEFKPTKNWAQEWNNQLKSRFGKELQSLPKKIDSLFDSTHVPELFSVVAQATVDSVSQRVYALIKTGKQPSIVKIYWL